MQNFSAITSGETLLNSLPKINNNDATLKSLFEGTAFPTTDLVLGMPCYRSDIDALFVLEQVSPAIWTRCPGALPLIKQSSGTLDLNTAGGGSWMTEVKNNSSMTIVGGPPNFNAGAVLQTEGSHSKWRTQTAFLQGSHEIWTRGAHDAAGVMTWGEWRCLTGYRDMFVESPQVITANRTIRSGVNTSTVGDIEIADGVEVDIADGGEWLML